MFLATIECCFHAAFYPRGVALNERPIPSSDPTLELVGNVDDATDLSKLLKLVVEKATNLGEFLRRCVRILLLEISRCN